MYVTLHTDNVHPPASYQSTPCSRPAPLSLSTLAMFEGKYALIKADTYHPQRHGQLNNLLDLRVTECNDAMLHKSYKLAEISGSFTANFHSPYTFCFSPTFLCLKCSLLHCCDSYFSSNAHSENKSKNK